MILSFLNIGVVEFSDWHKSVLYSGPCEKWNTIPNDEN